MAYTMLLGAVVLVWSDVGRLVDRLAQTLSSSSGRVEIWRETRPLIRDFWPMGTGLGSYQRAMLIYQQSDRAFFVNHAHNHYLHALAEGGVLVAVPAGLALAALVRLARRRLTMDRTGVVWIRAGAVAGLCAVAVQSVWETGLRMPANAALAAVLAAVVVHGSEAWRTGGPDHAAPTRL